MKSLTKTLVLFLLFYNPFTTTMNAQTDSFSAAHVKFKTVYERELKQSSIVGGSFVFIKDNRIIACEFYG